jgi:hypothetical protein
VCWRAHPGVKATVEMVTSSGMYTSAQKGMCTSGAMTAMGTSVQ